MNFQRNVLLKNYTTFKIGGRAKYFFVAKTKENLIKAIKVAKELKLPFFVLGGGSNLLVSDKGFKGLVIKIQNTKYKIQNTKIVAEAGTRLGDLVNASVEKSLTGLEWAVGIPGTVGGAINGNAGAFGKSMEDITKTVTVLEIKNRASITEGGKERIFFDHGSEGEEEDEVLFARQKSKFKTFKNKECKFGYRDSIFKKKKNLIILSTVFEFKKGKKSEIQNKVKKYLDYKKRTQPLNFPSAGSVFMNPKGFSAGELGEEDKSSSLSTELPKEVKVRKRMKFSCDFAAARLIEECGLKGKKIGNAKISEKHANFIVNLGSAQAKDVKKLIKLIKQKVKNKFRIVLKEEIQFL